MSFTHAPSSKAVSLLGFVPFWKKVWGAAAWSKEKEKMKRNNRLTLTLRTHSFYLSNKMCLSVLCVICVPPFSFCSKSTLVECLPFGCFSPRSHVTCCLPSLPCLFNQSASSASISNRSPDFSVCVHLLVCKCVCVHKLCIYSCSYVCACAPPPFPPLLSFICFPLQPLHVEMNAWV